MPPSNGAVATAPPAVPVRAALLGEIALAIAAQPGQWASLVRYTAERRWYRRLTLDEVHEVWLLSWLPGQCTGFHDHAASAGAFTVIRGALRERTATAGRPEL